MSKRLILAAGVLAATSAAAFVPVADTHAACAQTFYVGSRSAEACADIADGDLAEGFMYNAADKTITLNNYNGGPIYYQCHATCSTSMEATVTLVGLNNIYSKGDDWHEFSYPELYGVDAKSIDAAFYNIKPTMFSGDGDLYVKAGNLVAYEDAAPADSEIAFNIKGETAYRIHAGSKMNSVESVSEETETTTAALTKSTEELMAAGVDMASDLTETVTNAINKKSFFETTMGLAVLIAVPSILTLIIVILAVSLAKERKKNAGTPETPAEPIDTPVATPFPPENN